MKINKKQTLGALALMGGALGILGKSKATKIVGLGTSLISGGILLYQMYKEESKKIENQCQETEKAFEETGLDPEKIETTALLTGTEETTPQFAKIILEEIYRSAALPDEVLEYNYNAYLNTLHIGQNVEKNRLIVSIPLPIKNSKGGLGPQEVRDHFKNLFEEFIIENCLDMKNFLNQVGVVVTKDSNNPPYHYYEEILREEEESFHDYLIRITSYQKESIGGKAPRGCLLDEGESFLRIDQYLNLEFPVFPAYSNKKGLDLFLAVKLIKILTESTFIKSATGREIEFHLDHVAFHPKDDLGEIFLIKDGNEVVAYGL